MFSDPNDDKAAGAVGGVCSNASDPASTVGCFGRYEKSSSTYGSGCAVSLCGRGQANSRDLLEHVMCYHLCAYAQAYKQAQSGCACFIVRCNTLAEIDRRALLAKSSTSTESLAYVTPALSSSISTWSSISCTTDASFTISPIPTLNRSRS